MLNAHGEPFPALSPGIPTRPAESMRVSSLHALLRDATRESHHLIDHHPLMAPLVRSDLSRAGYLRALRGLLWIHEALQEELAAAMSGMADTFVLADRVDWLRNDLKALGATASFTSTRWQAPSLANAAELVGALYVVEGSTLGGQVIARRVEASLGLEPATGLLFFNGWGSETVQHWQAFWRFADAACGPAHDEAAASAVRLFAALNQAFDLAVTLQQATDQ